MFDLYKNVLDKDLGMYTAADAGLPAHATKKNWKLLRKGVQRAPPDAVRGIKRDGFYLYTSKLTFEIAEGDHPAARYARTKKTKKT